MRLLPWRSSLNKHMVKRNLERRPALFRCALSITRGWTAVDHYVHAVVPRQTVVRALRGYPRFFRDRAAYRRLSHEPVYWGDDNPQLLDWVGKSPFDRHYTYQDGWAAREIFNRRPASHVDVGSRISFVVGVAALIPVTFIDLRPLELSLPGLESRAGSILELPYDSGSVESISCLHVAEHIGLGRYGDPLDPEGTKKAAVELERVLAPRGFLYFSVPVGRPHTAFNAHRVFDPREVEGFFPSLCLDGFAGVDDAGVFHSDISPTALVRCRWGCGFYRFTRPS
jgi:hypothetical protein